MDALALVESTLSVAFADRSRKLHLYWLLQVDFFSLLCSFDFHPNFQSTVVETLLLGVPKIHLFLEGHKRLKKSHNSICRSKQKITPLLASAGGFFFSFVLFRLPSKLLVHSGITFNIRGCKNIKHYFSSLFCSNA